MFHCYSTPIIKETRVKIVTQIPGIFRINYIEKHDSRYQVFKYEKCTYKFIEVVPGAPNSAKFRGGCRGPSKIRQRGDCNNFLWSFYAKRLKKAYF